ncbi:MAG: peptidase M16, partial [Gammaproteobacteria bacterium]|nr:peptidase M16 [Gammaproteobacteria bacterium]
LIKMGLDRELIAYLTVSTRSLGRSFTEAANLLLDTINQPRFDETQRILELIQRLRVRRESSVVRNGHVLAMNAASRTLSPVVTIGHNTTGLGSLQWIRKFEEEIQQSGSEGRLEEILRSIHQRILINQPEALLISDTAHAENSKAQMIQQLSRLGGVTGSAGRSALQVPDVQAEGGKLLKEAWVTTTQVNFCASACMTVPDDHPDSPALQVLAGVLRNGFLHAQIREKGGAYGGGATYDGANGVFRFYSYRDPLLEETFQVFDSSADWLFSSNLMFDQVEESILGIVSSLDSPASPAGEARHAYHQTRQGRRFEFRTRYRQAVLGTGVEDVLRVAERYLANADFHRAVITSRARAESLVTDGFIIRET